MADDPRIERYFLGDVPTPAIPALGYAAQRSARPGLSPHHHTVLELCLIEHGTLWWFQEGRQYQLPPGSLFVSRPGEMHGAVGGLVQPSTFWWLQVELRHLPQEGLAGLLDELPTKASVTGGEPIRLHEQMLAECRARRADSPRVLEALLAIFLARVGREAGPEGGRGPPPPALRRALEAIEEAPTHPWRIPELQARAGVGRTRLFALFRERFGQSPAAYARARRLRKAQRLLRETRRSVTDIAHELGFSSSQHFATTFRQHHGVSPAAYRAMPMP